MRRAHHGYESSLCLTQPYSVIAFFFASFAVNYQKPTGVRSPGRFFDDVFDQCADFLGDFFTTRFSGGYAVGDAHQIGFVGEDIDADRERAHDDIVRV